MRFFRTRGFPIHRRLFSSIFGVFLVVLMILPIGGVGGSSASPPLHPAPAVRTPDCGTKISVSSNLPPLTECSLGVTVPYSGVVTVPASSSTAAFDWPELHRNPSLSGVLYNSSLSTLNAANLGVAWATDMYGPALDSPVVSYDPTLHETLAYIGTDYGDILAVNVANGQIVWGAWLGSAIRGTPLLNGGNLYVATFTTPAFYKLDDSTGAVECSRILPQPVEGTPTVGTPPGGVRTIYLGTEGTAANGPFYALNAGNCSVEWQFSAYNTPGTGSWDSASYGLNATGVPIVIFGSDDPDSSVYTLNALTGHLLWRFQAYNPNHGDYDVAAGVLISGPGINGFAQGVAYTTNKIGRAYALDLNNGTLIWETNFNALAGTSEVARSTPARDGVNLVFGYHGGLFDLNAVTGKEIWMYQDPSDTESVASPAIVGAKSDAVVVTGDIGGGIDVVSLKTGAQLYQYETGGYITASPAVAGANILIASSDGFLYDLAVGGGNNATLPTTTVTAPADDSTLANPNGNQSVAGAASDSDGVAAVEVAVQSGGPTGPWWDAATRTWDSGPVNNPATLSASGAKSSPWNFAYPVPKAGGTYTVFAYAVSRSGQSDLSGADSGFTVLFSAVGPNLQVTPSFIAPGLTVSVTGGGFVSSERVAIRLAGTILVILTASSTGSISASKVKIPASASFGRTSLLATGNTSGRSATVALTIGNSWEQFADGPGHTGYEANDSVLNYLISFNRNWVHLAWHFDPGTSFNASPVVVDGVAYVGDTSGHLYAVDVHNGGLIWTSTSASGAPLNTTPAVDPAAGLVFVSANDGNLSALSVTTGLTVWSASVGGNLTAPAFVDGQVYVASTDGTVEALAESTGVPSWSVSLGGAITGAPAIDASKKLLVVGLSNGDVRAMDLTTGTTSWTYLTGGAVAAAVSIASGTVYFGSADEYVYAISELTGALDWSYQTGGAVMDTGVYTNHGTVAGPELVIGSNDGNLYVIHASNGSLEYQISYSSPIVGVGAASGVVVLETASGKISSDRTFVSDELWVYAAGGGLTSAPVIVDGTIYVAAQNGNLYAFTSYGQPPD